MRSTGRESVRERHDRIFKAQPPRKVWLELTERQKLTLDGLVEIGDEHELVRGWPRIGRVVGYSVKSCKLFEHTCGLPVFRCRAKQGDKSRVFAVLSQLLDWRAWRREADGCPPGA